METWRRVEVAACEELPALLGDAGPSAQDLDADPRRHLHGRAVDEREKVTDHDMAAFVDVLGASAGPAGRWIHFGLTSSDVLDTALALQLEPPARSCSKAPTSWLRRSRARAREHVGTLCVGRTHGVHAEPTTFGVKLAGFAFEAAPQRRRLRAAFEQVAVGALSGAVGTYAATDPDFEARVLGAARARARGRLHAGRRPRPPRRAAERDRARRSGPRALRDWRSATSSAPRCERRRSRSAPARRAPRRCPTSATRSRPSRSPVSRACFAAMLSGGTRGRRPLARARHLALLGRARRSCRTRRS